MHKKTPHQPQNILKQSKNSIVSVQNSPVHTHPTQKNPQHVFNYSMTAQANHHPTNLPLPKSLVCQYTRVAHKTQDTQPPAPDDNNATSVPNHLTPRPKVSLPPPLHPRGSKDTNNPIAHPHTQPPTNGTGSSSGSAPSNSKNIPPLYKAQENPNLS